MYCSGTKVNHYHVLVHFRVISWIVPCGEADSFLKQVIPNAMNSFSGSDPGPRRSATPAKKPTQKSKREPNSQSYAYRLPRMMFDVAL